MSNEWTRDDLPREDEILDSDHWDATAENLVVMELTLAAVVKRLNRDHPKPGEPIEKGAS